MVSTDDSFVTWDISATYFLSEQMNIYGRVATGARAPSIQGRILFVPDFDFGMNPETDGVTVADTEDILSFEVGIKTELLERRLRFNFTVYTWETSDQQLTIIGGAANVAELVNADKVDGRGFETDIEWAPTPRWLATFGLSYNKTEIKDESLTVNGCRLCTITDPVAPNGEFSINGNSLPHAPEWIFNGIIDYRLPRGDDGLFFGSLDWAYYDEKQFFLYESEEFRDDSRRSSGTTPWRSVCDSATPSTRPGTRWRSMHATSSTTRSCAVVSTSATTPVSPTIHGSWDSSSSFVPGRP
jgi:iron complex outermembrane receptor protein